jgi:hypothetical protein
MMNHQHVRTHRHRSFALFHLAALSIALSIALLALALVAYLAAIRKHADAERLLFDTPKLQMIHYREKHLSTIASRSPRASQTTPQLIPPPPPYCPAMYPSETPIVPSVEHQLPPRPRELFASPFSRKWYQHLPTRNRLNIHRWRFPGYLEIRN